MQLMPHLVVLGHIYVPIKCVVDVLDGSRSAKFWGNKTDVNR